MYVYIKYSMFILLTWAGDSNVWICSVACPSSADGKNTDLKYLSAVTAIDRQRVICLIQKLWYHNTRYTYIGTVSSNGTKLIGRSSPVSDNISTDLV